MSDLIWKTEKRKLSDLIPYEKNPRKISEKQRKDLKKSLVKFNLVELPAINLDNKIIAGHQRLSIMRDLYPPDHEVEVRVPNRQLTEDEFKEYLIRSNKNTGDWDFDTLTQDFSLPELMDWGFDKNEFKGIEDPINNEGEDPLKLNESFEVVCECSTEEEQQELFQKLTDEGVKCRLLTF